MNYFDIFEKLVSLDFQRFTRSYSNLAERPIWTLDNLDVDVEVFRIVGTSKAGVFGVKGVTNAHSAHSLDLGN